MSEEFKTIRDTPLGQCIGATILDITAADKDEFFEGGENAHKVYFHLSNGETIFATIGTDGEELLGMLGTEDEAENGGNNG